MAASRSSSKSRPKKIHISAETGEIAGLQGRIGHVVVVDLSYLGGLVVREQQLLLLDGLSLVEFLEALVDLALLPSCGHPLRANRMQNIV